jgi:hypothetical protein
VLLEPAAGAVAERGREVPMLCSFDQKLDFPSGAPMVSCLPN